MKTDARRCPECGTTYLVDTGCTACNPNNSPEEAPKKTKRQPKDEPLTGGAAAVVVAPVTLNQMKLF